MSKGNRVAIYLRVSTSKQCTARQLSDLKEYCQARKLTIHEVYQDKISGAKAKRPGLNKLMSDASKRKIDIVLVHSLDRFGRSIAHIVRSLESLNELGVGFISYREGIDLNSSAGRFMAHILSALATMERELICERVKSGIEFARKRGRKLGRPRKRDDAKIIEMHSNGMSQSAIAKKTGLARSTVQESLKRGAGKTFDSSTLTA